jgi:glycosyltransferase involved in cell wall biosynthesis
MQRILLIHNILFEKGGAETHFLSEIELLRGRGFEVHVFGFSDVPIEPTDETKTFGYAEPRSWVLQKVLKFTFHPGAYRALRHTIERVCPDVIHLHMNTKYPLAVLMALRNMPVVQTIHSNGMFCPTGWLVRADDLQVCPGGAGIQCVRHGCVPVVALPVHVSFQFVWHALARRVVKAFMSPSQHLCRYLEKFGFGPVKWLPNFSPEAAPEYEPIPNESQKILYVGVLTRQKGVEFLLRAMPDVIDVHPGARAVIVGDGPDSERLQTIARELGIEHVVEFTGRIPNRELMAYYRSARVCVIPSLWLENSPIVAYESMLAGRPLVGSDRGGIPDLIERSEGGRVFPAMDSKAMARCLNELLESHELATRLGENARRFALTSLSKQAFLDRLLPVLDATASRPEP